MEGVACVKMKGIQKRHSTGVWILKHAGLVVQFSDSAERAGLRCRCILTSIYQMIKSCHRSAGMTECLINFKYTVFGQPNEIRWKILSQMAGQPIFKLCVGSCRGGFVPIITFILSCNRSFRFHSESTEGVIVSRPLGKKGDKYFRQRALLCST